MFQEQTPNDSTKIQLPQNNGGNAVPTFNITKKRIDPAILEQVGTFGRNDSQIDTLQQKKQVVKSVVREQIEMPLLMPRWGNRVELLKQYTERPSIHLPEKALKDGNPEWLTGIFLLIMFLFVIVRLFYKKYLEQLIQSVISYGASFRMFREKSSGIENASFFLDIISFLIFSLFVFQTLDVFEIRWPIADWFKFIILFAGIVVFQITKKMLYLFQGVLTESNTETREFIFNLNIHTQILGLLLFPVCLIIAFSPIANLKFVTSLGLIFIIFIYILLILRGIKILIKKQFSIFYLILYLCALEILPLILIYKLVLK